MNTVSVPIWPGNETKKQGVVPFPDTQDGLGMRLVAMQWSYSQIYGITRHKAQSQDMMIEPELPEVQSKVKSPWRS